MPPDFGIDLFVKDLVQTSGSKAASCYTILARVSCRLLGNLQCMSSRRPAWAVAWKISRLSIPNLFRKIVLCHHQDDVVGYGLRRQLYETRGASCGLIGIHISLELWRHQRKYKDVVTQALFRVQHRHIPDMEYHRELPRLATVDSRMNRTEV